MNHKTHYIYIDSFDSYERIINHISKCTKASGGAYVRERLIIFKP